ncbi:MAG: ACT domain-containing protein [Phycisphaerae bacterium]
MRSEMQFSVFLINKPGVLATVTGALARAKVNIIALSLSDSGEHGVLRIVPDSADAAREVLGKAHDRWTETEVLVAELPNQPGAFAAAAERLAREHVNISYAYCTGGAPGGKTTAVFKVADTNKARKALQAVESPGKAPKSTSDVRPNPSRNR